MLPTSLHRAISGFFGLDITASAPVSGGDIHQAARLQLADGRWVFVKYNTAAGAADMFLREAQGLALLGAPGVIAVPKVLHHEAVEDMAYLLLHYVTPGYKNRLFWEKFGIQLADLHGNTSATFGFAHDNYIGRLPQSNRRHDAWPDFYAAERLLPQVKTARDNGHFGSEESRWADRLCHRLASLCPPEQPSLIHGDLWSGNFLCNEQGEPVIIDPAACYAHREMDLAMTRLFGGFDAQFYTAYQQAWPLENGWEERAEIYQLYYVLVHVNLFGGGYVDQARRTLRRFA